MLIVVGIVPSAFAPLLPRAVAWFGRALFAGGLAWLGYALWLGTPKPDGQPKFATWDGVPVRESRPCMVLGSRRFAN